MTALDTAITAVAERLDTLDADTLARVDATARLDVSEWIALGDKATLALAEGRCNTETAQQLHVIHAAFRTTASLAERVVFMQAMVELAS